MDISILIEARGNMWEKGNMRRIYLNDASIVNLFGLNDEDALKLKKIKPAKKTTYYCLVTESFVSANGSIVRNAIRETFPKETVRKA